MPSPMPKQLRFAAEGGNPDCNICLTKILEGEWAQEYAAVLESGRTLAHLECVREVTRAEYIHKVLWVGSLL